VDVLRAPPSGQKVNTLALHTTPSLCCAAALFDRWTEWEPDDAAWTSYVRLELRANQPARARAVFQRYVVCHNVPRAWIKWAKFEEKQGQVRDIIFIHRLRSAGSKK